MAETIKTAVVTGRHGFDVIGFTEMFRALDSVDPYIQHMEHFCSDPKRAAYDVVLFYHMLVDGPSDAEREAVQSILGNGQGFFIFHHAILGWPEWPEYDELVGIEDRENFTFDHDQQLTVDVVADHPITKELPEQWQLLDETYGMSNATSENGSEVLLTTDHKVSMHSLAWTRPHEKSRIFCFQCGHDNEAFSNSCLRTVMERGIQWCDGRI